MGNSKARYLLAACHISPPSQKSMQNAASKVSDQVKDLNTKDMCSRRKAISKLRKDISGCSSMNVSLDARYNATTFGSRSKSGQNASQAIMTAVNADGEEREIIDLFVQNKLCYEGSWLRSHGYTVSCPGHPCCTANTDRTYPLSEFTMGEKIGENFCLDDLLIKYVCTDGDARSAEGLGKAMSKDNALWNVLRQADTVHLGCSQYRKCLKCEFSNGFFPNHLTTMEQKKDLQRIFSEDIRSRCHLTFDNLYNICDGNVHKMSIKSKYLISMLIKCYSGDHSKCKKNGTLIGCTGGKVKNWFSKSVFFNTLPYKLTKFNMSHADKLLVKEIVKMKLGIKCIELMKFKFDTCKNESCNRAISTSLPKNVKFSRNVEGRAHSAVHRVNYGLGESLHLKLEKVGASLAKGGHVAKDVKQLNSVSQYHKKYLKRKSVKKNIANQKCIQRYEYNQTKRNRKARDMYQKGLLDNKPQVSRLRRNKQKLDHTYSEFDWS